MTGCNTYLYGVFICLIYRSSVRSPPEYVGLVIGGFVGFAVMGFHH